jgi:hypothetical protein
MIDKNFDRNFNRMRNIFWIMFIFISILIVAGIVASVFFGYSIFTNPEGVGEFAGKVMKGFESTK